MAWRDDMNADIKRYFGIDETAEVVDIETDRETRGYGGCSTCTYTVFLVKVAYRTETGLRGTATYEGNIADFLRDVAERAAQDAAADEETGPEDRTDRFDPTYFG